MNIQNLISFCQFVLKILSKKQIMTSIKGHNSVANLQKNNYLQYQCISFLNDDGHTKFGLILSISSQEKTNSDINQEPLLGCKFAKNQVYNTNLGLVNDNVYTEFGLNLSICSQDIEHKPNSDVNQEP